MNIEYIILGGGCFWCLQPVFEGLHGVVHTECGYCNGHTVHPTYEQVCTGRTGHVEVVQVQFDASLVTLEQLLKVFFSIHDPTTLNRQGHDVGTQYRSGVYAQTLEQQQRVQEWLDRLKTHLSATSPIVTELALVQGYTPAEAYHQHYFDQNPHQGYCTHVIAPKVLDFRQRFAQWLKSGA